MGYPSGEEEGNAASAFLSRVLLASLVDDRNGGDSYR